MTFSTLAGEGPCYLAALAASSSSSLKALALMGITGSSMGFNLVWHLS